MIPPGVHFVYFSVKTAPRIGFFHNFKGREIVVRKWDEKLEDMSIQPVSDAEVCLILCFGNFFFCSICLEKVFVFIASGICGISCKNFSGET